VEFSWALLRYDGPVGWEDCDVWLFTAVQPPNEEGRGGEDSRVGCGGRGMVTARADQQKIQCELASYPDVTNWSRGAE
jgi:hypothetical protein